MSMQLMGVPDKKQRKFNIYTIEECGHGSKDKNGKFEKGTKYEGEFKFEKGTKYEGEFKDGKRHGQGILKDSDGKIIYEGEWKDDKPDGKGTITIPNSSCKKSARTSLEALLLIRFNILSSRETKPFIISYCLLFIKNRSLKHSLPKQDEMFVDICVNKLSKPSPFNEETES